MNPLCVGSLALSQDSPVERGKPRGAFAQQVPAHRPEKSGCFVCVVIIQIGVHQPLVDRGLAQRLPNGRWMAAADKQVVTRFEIAGRHLEKGNANG